MFIKRLMVEGRVVSVERGQKQVAGERGLDADLRRFKVANLAHEDDVGILTKEGAKGGGEGSKPICSFI